MNKDTEFLIELVKNASLLINDEFQVKAKGNNGDLVTNFDLEIEEYMIKEIKSSYPEFSIVSEEYNAENDLTDNCFIIDPIDGTINFAHNLPLWGIQVACIRDSKTCAAVIYLPKLNELYYADETGAYLNDKQIFVNQLDTTKGLYTIEAANKLPAQVKMKKINPYCRDFACAAIDFAWVASGRLSATIFRKDSFWDYIPGQYLVEKAGGFIYNSNKAHIAANNEIFLEVIKDNASLIENEQVTIVTEKL